MYREVAEEESEHRSHISLMLFSIPALLYPANRRVFIKLWVDNKSEYKYNLNNNKNNTEYNNKRQEQGHGVA